MNLDEHIENMLGKFIDIAVRDLYWNNSLFSSNDFSKILTHLEKYKDICVVKEQKKRFFCVILRNMVYMSKKDQKQGNFNIPYIAEMYFAYALYVRNPTYLLQMSDILFDNKQNQLAFLNNVVSTNNFPSKYDSYNKLYDFVLECTHMSNFVNSKDKCQTNMTHTHCDNTSLPNSIDKILETITKILDSETSDLTDEQQQMLDTLDLK